MIPFHIEQLELMSKLAQHRPEYLNPFFLFLNYFDTDYFFYVLIPILWFCSYKWAFRIYYWSTLSTFLNGAAKIWVGWPRPCVELPGTGLLNLTSPGFPSGGAQTAMFLGILLIYYRRDLLYVGLIYIALISFSRIYLGVHFPIDILGGWFIGAAFAYAFIASKEAIDQFFAGRALIGFFLSFLGAIVLHFTMPEWAAPMILMGFLPLAKQLTE